MNIGQKLDNLKKIMIKQERLSKEEASFLLEEVLNLLLEFDHGRACDQLLKFKDYWFNEEKKDLGHHSNAPKDCNNIPDGEVGPVCTPGDLGPSNCPKGEILEKLHFTCANKCEHKMPFYLGKDTTLSLEPKCGSGKIMLLFLNDNGQVFSDIELNVPTGSQINFSMEGTDNGSVQNTQY